MVGKGFYCICINEAVARQWKLFENLGGNAVKIIFRKRNVNVGILLVAVLFSLFFFVSPGTANEDIFSIAQRGDIDGVREIIAGIENIDDFRNENQATLLHTAAFRGFPEIMELLINASADVNLKSVKV